MKTVDKALTVLDQFSMSQTEIGLNELARMAGLDKAATRRLLIAMCDHGFIEQSSETRKYRLGHGFLRLARIREATVPVTQAAKEATEWLTEQTNETAHASLPGPLGLTSIAHKMPNRARVININPAEVLSYHATSSGLVYLAFASSQTVEPLLALKREKLTPDTVTGKAELLKLLKQFRQNGFAQTRNTFEVDVASIAMPFYTDGLDPTGSIALAFSDVEMTPDRLKTLVPLLAQAKGRIEKALTGL